MTVLYSFKVLYWTFYSPTFVGYRTVLTAWHNPSVMELIVLSFLTALSILFGYIFRDQFIGLGSNFFGNSLSDKTVFVDAEFLPASIKLLPLIFSIGAIITAHYVSTKMTVRVMNFYMMSNSLTSLFRFLSNK
jgi:NADH-ubiquinone oxidoreductase chain 5